MHLSSLLLGVWERLGLSAAFHITEIKAACHIHVRQNPAFLGVSGDLQLLPPIGAHPPGGRLYYLL